MYNCIMDVSFVLKPNTVIMRAEIIYKHLFITYVHQNIQNIFENFMRLLSVKTQVTILHIDQNTD